MRVCIVKYRRVAPIFCSLLRRWIIAPRILLLSGSFVLLACVACVNIPTRVMGFGCPTRGVWCMAFGGTLHRTPIETSASLFSYAMRSLYVAFDTYSRPGLCSQDKYVNCILETECSSRKTFFFIFLSFRRLTLILAEPMSHSGKGEWGGSFPPLSLLRITRTR